MPRTACAARKPARTGNTGARAAGRPTRADISGGIGNFLHKKHLGVHLRRTCGEDPVRAAKELCTCGCLAASDSLLCVTYSTPGLLLACFTPVTRLRKGLSGVNLALIFVKLTYVPHCEVPICPSLRCRRPRTSREGNPPPPPVLFIWAHYSSDSKVTETLTHAEGHVSVITKVASARELGLFTTQQLLPAMAKEKAGNSRVTVTLEPNFGAHQFSLTLLELQELDDGEVFQWSSKVTTSICNLILGKVYLNHHGTMHIRGNRQYSCNLKFKEQSILD
ncbi:hypothetical protein HYC85_029967 [Camellia sinensis]|uniref:Uncharacterized protein n=1 Tax=Camellia sinensis TaxID=4442 RepID=A0A7J7G3D3_CAMSI|nr:hypothetical protein HYC85_029967 [Camellia sinensis]